jgi:hypothetical protein
MSTVSNQSTLVTLEDGSVIRIDTTVTVTELNKKD